MTLDLRQLRFAVTAADTSSFLRASKQLNVKQSTLSKKVAALEQRLGITLFERSTRGVVPTDAGRAFLEVARRIVTDADNLLTTAKAVTYGEVGRPGGACRPAGRSFCSSKPKSECARGQKTETPRPQEQAARPAGQSASTAPFRFTGRCGVSPPKG